MEETNVAPSFLLNLSTEVVEEIFQHLALPDRKNLRLTCKRFYELCNSDRFCRCEKIRWSEDLLIHHVNVQSDLYRIGRHYYNLVIEKEKLEKPSFLPFFKKFGTRVRSLIFHDCNFLPGSLESIITLCGGLCSLCLTFSPAGLIPNLDILKLQPFSITRPNVTYLKLTLPPEKPYEYFHRMFSIFPNVKQLDINFIHHGCYQIRNLSACVKNATKVCSSFLDDIMKSGSSLEFLQLNIPLGQSITRRNFFQALPKLKELSINFNLKSLNEMELWYPRCSNLVFIKLQGLEVLRPLEMIYLLTNTRLKNLNVASKSLIFDKESFEKLVASQLDTLRFHQVKFISGPPVIILDSPLAANETIRTLTLYNQKEIPESTIMLFMKYFCGLAHLSIYNYLTDTNLQCIFRYQKNLQSLKLSECDECSIKGFCGTKNGTDYSISNLQKLKHLTIYQGPTAVIQSDDFKHAISLLRLKYLYIYSGAGSGVRGAPRYAQIPTGLYENLTELRALRLRDAAMPSHETLSSMFRRIKNLNYLRYDMIRPEGVVATDSVTFINAKCKHFTINTEKYKYAYSLGHANFIQDLDRMVISNASLEQTLYSPKFRSFKIDWIKS